jgi:hypothetical protein
MEKFDLLELGVQYKDAYGSTAKIPNARVPRVLAFVVLYAIRGSGLAVIESTVVTLYIFDKAPLERRQSRLLFGPSWSQEVRFSRGWGVNCTTAKSSTSVIAL